MTTNFPTNIKIVVNATPLLAPLTGIGQYLFHLMRAIQTGHAGIESHFFYGYGWDCTLRTAPMPGIGGGLREIVKRALPRPYLVKRAFEQYNFGRGANKIKPDLYHEPNFQPLDFDGPTIITVHDLSCFSHPETHPPQRVEAMRRYLPAALERANCILTDSHFVKEEITRYFGVAPQKIVPIHLGVSPAFRPHKEDETQAALARWGLRHGHYLLAVGTREPRKNLAQALHAYQMLPERLRREYPLVIAGMKGWKSDPFTPEQEQLARRGQLQILGYVSDVELPMLYAGASMLIYPSLYEGFGLPPLEGMASGIPVITSDRASLPEVVAEAGIMLDPGDVDGLSQAILALLEDSAEHARRVELGLQQSRLFSWEKCAEKTVAVYENIMNGRPAAVGNK